MKIPPGFKKPPTIVGKAGIWWRSVTAKSEIERRLPARSITPGPSDVFLVSYPRSGNTWLRVLMACVTLRRPVESVSELQAIVPDIHYLHFPQKSENEYGRFRLIKSHFPFSRNYQKVIYIIRDPRDVIPSYHKFVSTHGRNKKDLSAFVPECCHGRVWPCSWNEHVSSWLLDRSEEEKPMLIRYENLAGDTRTEVRRVCEFIGLDRTDDEIEQAIQWSTPELVAQTSTWKRDRSETVRDGFSTHSKAGGWSAQMTPDVLKEIEKRCEGPMRQLGYLAGAEASS